MSRRKVSPTNSAYRRSASPDKFLGEKEIVEESGEEAGITLKTRIALNVSTVGSHPGKTLGGCSYQIEVQ